MRVGGAASAYGTQPAAPKAQPKQVEPTRTPVSRGDLRAAIGRAHEKLTGQPPSKDLLDTLTAQASLETGSGGQMYNFNFGGIKGVSPTGETALTRTKEVFNGKEVEVRDGFRAYRSLDDGALDYVKLMKGRFGGAVAEAEKGNLDGFAKALKKANYYTADEAKYASALRALAGAPAGPPTATPAQTTMPALPNTRVASVDAGGADRVAFPDTLELGRVLDAIAQHRETVEDDDEA